MESSSTKTKPHKNKPQKYSFLKPNNKTYLPKSFQKPKPLNTKHHSKKKKLSSHHHPQPLPTPPPLQLPETPPPLPSPPIPSILTHLQPYFHINNLHSDYIRSPLLLSDNRLATASGDGSLSICSINFTTKQWSQDIKLLKAHSDWIQSLMELPNNRLVSCSGDKTIKIWRIYPDILIHLHTITTHTDWVRKVISLSPTVFASCSDDKTIKLHSSEHQHHYQEITTFVNEDAICSIIKLSNRDMLIASCASLRIHCYDLCLYKKVHTVKHVYAFLPTHMIELHGGLIAVSSDTNDKPIVIIECEGFTVVKELKEKEFVMYPSTICEWDMFSFVYVYNGCCMQVARKEKEFEVVFKEKIDTNVEGYYGMIKVECECECGNEKKKEKLLVVENKSYGVTIVKGVVVNNE